MFKKLIVLLSFMVAAVSYADVTEYTDQEALCHADWAFAPDFEEITRQVRLYAVEIDDTYTLKENAEEFVEDHSNNFWHAVGGFFSSFWNGVNRPVALTTELDVTPMDVSTYENRYRKDLTTFKTNSSMAMSVEYGKGMVTNLNCELAMFEARFQPNNPYFGFNCMPVDYSFEEMNNILVSMDAIKQMPKDVQAAAFNELDKGQLFAATLAARINKKFKYFDQTETFFDCAAYIDELDLEDEEEEGDVLSFSIDSEDDEDEDNTED